METDFFAGASEPRAACSVAISVPAGTMTVRIGTMRPPVRCLSIARSTSASDDIDTASPSASVCRRRTTSTGTPNVFAATASIIDFVAKGTDTRRVSAPRRSLMSIAEGARGAGRGAQSGVYRRLRDCRYTAV